MEQDAQSVGWNMQVCGFLVLGHHGHSVGVGHTFGYTTAFLGKILGFSQTDDSDEVGEQQYKTDCQGNQGNNLSN